MKISEHLTPSLIKIGLESEEKDELFEEMVHLFVENGLIEDREKAVQTLIEREDQMSTGIGNGLALPHGKLEEASGLLMALGISQDGIEYDAIDDEPVYVVIAVFAEIGNPGPHIEALAEISRVFTAPGFMNRIRQASTPQQVLELFKAEE